MARQVKYSWHIDVPTFTIREIEETLGRRAEDPIGHSPWNYSFDPQDDYINTVVTIQFTLRSKRYAFQCGAYYTPLSIDDGVVTWDDSDEQCTWEDIDEVDYRPRFKADGTGTIDDTYVPSVQHGDPQRHANMIAMDIFAKIGIPDAIVQ